MSRKARVVAAEPATADKMQAIYDAEMAEKGEGQPTGAANPGAETTSEEAPGPDAAASSSAAPAPGASAIERILLGDLDLTEANLSADQRAAILKVGDRLKGLDAREKELAINDGLRQFLQEDPGAAAILFQRKQARARGLDPDALPQIGPAPPAAPKKLTADELAELPPDEAYRYLAEQTALILEAKQAAALQRIEAKVDGILRVNEEEGDLLEHHPEYAELGPDHKLVALTDKIQKRSIPAPGQLPLLSLREAYEEAVDLVRIATQDHAATQQRDAAAAASRSHKPGHATTREAPLPDFTNIRGGADRFEAIAKAIAKKNGVYQE